jgi:hypothetical protein
MDMEHSQPHIWAAISQAPVRSFLRVTSLPGNWWGEENRWALEEAVRKGLLLRVRKRLYYKGAHSRYGMTHPRAEELVREVLGERGVGPSGYSAARALGLTTQLPPKYEVTTFKIVGAIQGVSQRARSNQLRAGLNAREIAILEVLRAPDVFSERGWDAFVQAVRDLAARGEVDVHRTFAAARAERHVATRANASRLREALNFQNSVQLPTILETEEGEQP